jgi:hypothetical protein
MDLWFLCYLEQGQRLCQRSIVTNYSPPRFLMLPCRVRPLCTGPQPTINTPLSEIGGRVSSHARQWCVKIPTRLSSPLALHYQEVSTQDDLELNLVW